MQSGAKKVDEAPLKGFALLLQADVQTKKNLFMFAFERFCCHADKKHRHLGNRWRVHYPCTQYLVHRRLGNPYLANAYVENFAYSAKVSTLKK
jgi:hypothetical protein